MLQINQNAKVKFKNGYVIFSTSSKLIINLKELKILIMIAIVRYSVDYLESMY